jgi:GTP-binding protein
VQSKAGNRDNGYFNSRWGKFIPKHGLNGGDGGNGGDVILISDENVNDLSVYRFTPHAKAENEEHGTGNEMDRGNDKHCLIRIRKMLSRK